jgi:molybdopterin synthase catalytic subunit
MIRLRTTAFDPSDALAGFMTRAGTGAVVSFVGVVREDSSVRRLSIQHYPGFTESEVELFVAIVKSRHRLTAIEIVHRVGSMKPGEPIMFAATSAPHRRAAIDGLDELMDRLKADAPFWKLEELASGEHRWIEATCGDELRRRAMNDDG